MKLIETVIWEPVPGKPNYVMKKGFRKVSEVFAELESELKSEGLYPEEYFLLDRDFQNENMLCPEFQDVISYAQWGTNEGIYLEIEVVILNEQSGRYERKSFATGKTLKEDSDSFDRMQYTAGFVYKLFRGDRQISPRYKIIHSDNASSSERAMRKLRKEYAAYMRNVFVHKPVEMTKAGDEVGIRSLILQNISNLELPNSKWEELLDSENSLELLTKICRHVLEPDSFEISDSILACKSFGDELLRQSELKKNN